MERGGDGDASASFRSAQRVPGRGRGRRLIADPVATGFGVKQQLQCQGRPVSTQASGTSVQIDQDKSGISTGATATVVPDKPTPCTAGDGDASSSFRSAVRVRGRGRGRRPIADPVGPGFGVKQHQPGQGRPVSTQASGTSVQRSCRESSLEVRGQQCHAVDPPLAEASTGVTSTSNDVTQRVNKEVSPEIRGYQFCVVDPDWTDVDLFTRAMQNPITLTSEEIHEVLPAVWREVGRDASVVKAAAMFSVAVILMDKRGIFLHDLMEACYSCFDLLGPATPTSSEQQEREECPETRLAYLGFILELVREIGKDNDTAYELREVACSLSVLFCGYCTDLMYSPAMENDTYVQCIQEVVLRANGSVDRFAPFSVRALAALAANRATELSISKLKL